MRIASVGLAFSTLAAAACAPSNPQVTHPPIGQMSHDEAASWLTANLERLTTRVSVNGVSGVRDVLTEHCALSYRRHAARRLFAVVVPLAHVQRVRVEPSYGRSKRPTVGIQWLGGDSTSPDTLNATITLRDDSRSARHDADTVVAVLQHLVTFCAGHAGMPSSLLRHTSIPVVPVAQARTW